MAVTPQPVLYLSHGAPPLADDERWTGRARALVRDLPKPDKLLIVSAHWEDAPTTLGTTTGAPLTYDFWGFPQRYYEVTYDAPAAPALADEVPSCSPRRGHARAPRRGPRPRPRRLRAAQGDVPRRRRAGAPDVDADPRPAAACSRSAAARAAARAGHDDRRLGLHDPQPALVQPGRRPDAPPPGGRRVRPLGPGGDAGPGRRRLLDFLDKARPRTRPTRAPSTSRRSSSPSAPPTSPAASTTGASSTASGSACRSAPGSSAEGRPRSTREPHRAQPDRPGLRR